MTNITFEACEHNLNQVNCCTCLSGYPRKCSCGGLIHAEVSKNSFPGITIVYKCDKCDFILDAVED